MQPRTRYVVASAVVYPNNTNNGRIPGSKAMWVGIYCELTEFGLMFLVYFLARAHHPEAFNAGPQKLSMLAGTVITLIMITSSYFVARAIHAIRRNQAHRSLAWLTAALVTGFGYPIAKIFELRWNFAHGLNGGGDVFQMTYYYLTLNHFVHVSWGLLGLVWVMVRTHLEAYKADDYAGLEAFACYWHATDLVWLMIFPLLYVLR